jgi:hypothetical protein
MKITILLIAVTALLVLASTEKVFAQERTPVKVKSSQVVTGVVVVDVVKDGKTFELQCNQGASECNVLKTGGYVMVELPKNYGMYDCKNVEIYREDKDKPEGTERLGRYCLIEK